MPCDSVQTSKSVPLAKVDFRRMEQALRADGWNVTVSGELLSAVTYDERGYAQRIVLRKGEETAEISTSGRDAIESIANRVKRAYAAKVVVDLAERYGWTIKGKSKTGNQTTLQFRR